MAEKEEKPKVCAEVVKANQGIAAQAALRAQQIMFRQKLNSVSISSESATTSAQKALLKKATPPVPARGESTLTKKPPEIPPKRNSLKQTKDSCGQQLCKQPPPLPQKPNSPLTTPKLKEKPLRPVPPTPQISKIDRPPANLPQSTTASTNPFNSLRNSPQSNQQNISTILISTNVSSNLDKNTTMAKRQMSPIEDLSSEDALRGIESGLRNMERAMQEQMNIRSIESAPQIQNEKCITQFNPIRIGGSIAPLNDGRNKLESASTQNMTVIESMRLALNRNMRSMERGFSMDQMRNLETNNDNANGGQRSFENHMKSLDRNLPLELQYSRHNRSQSQQEIVDQIRHNIPNLLTGAIILSREDIRLRRRSSHDENQMMQTQKNNTGKTHWRFIKSLFFKVFSLFVNEKYELNYYTFPNAYCRANLHLVKVLSHYGKIISIRFLGRKSQKNSQTPKVDLETIRYSAISD